MSTETHTFMLNILTSSIDSQMNKIGLKRGIASGERRERWF